MKGTQLRTRLSCQECVRRLDDAIGCDGIRTGFGLLTDRRVIGWVNSNGFSLRIRIAYQNSFQTFLRGRFIPDGTGTTVDLEAGLHPLVTICLGLVGVAALYVGWIYGAEAIHLLRSEGLAEALPSIGSTIGLPVFGLVALAAGRWFARDEEEQLVRLVRETLAEDGARRSPAS